MTVRNVVKANKIAAAAMVLMCLFALFSPLVLEAKSEASGGIIDKCAHCCASDTHDAGDDQIEGEPCNSSSCYRICCMEMVLPKKCIVNLPADMAKNDVTRCEKFKLKDIICSIFKPPKGI